MDVVDPLNPLALLLADGRIAVIDGGLATELEAEGHHLGDELWSARLLADEPEAIAVVEVEDGAEGREAQTVPPGAESRRDERGTGEEGAMAVSLAPLPQTRYRPWPSGGNTG